MLLLDRHGMLLLTRPKYTCYNLYLSYKLKNMFFLANQNTGFYPFDKMQISSLEAKSSIENLNKVVLC